MASFLEAIEFLGTTGLFSAILPGILIMLLVYAILSKYNVFGEDKNTINILVSFIFGFILMSFAQALKFITYLISELY